LTIRLAQSVEQRLERLARRTGRTKSFYIREALLRHLKDIEDLYLAEHSLKRIRAGKDRTIPLEKILKRRGIGNFTQPST
jgi:RHH-type transcriptional regulator, rel operon repressor / antitoxin RelB